MRNTGITGLAAAVAAAALWIAPVSAQDVNDDPITQNWAPSLWGADDKAGSVNRTTPEIVMKAVGLVKKGKTATLGKIYAGDAPAFGSRGCIPCSSAGTATVT